MTLTSPGKRPTKATSVKMKRFLLTIITIILVIATGCGGEPSSTEDIVDVVSKAVVRIIAREAMGSGMIIDENGYILTNSHVVEGVTSVTVELSNGKQWGGRVTGRDEINDLAVIKIDSSRLPTVTLGDSAGLRPGQEVIAIGYPLDLAGSVTVTKGIVSAIREYDLIQTDVSINPGNSGGPLVNLSGEVIGVNFAGFRMYRGMLVEGMNFAVAINTAKEVIPDLRVGRSTFAPSSAPTSTSKPATEPAPTTTSPPEPRYTLAINGQQVTSSSISITGGTIRLNLTPDANGKYAKGSTLTLTTTPTSGWQVERWSGTNDDSLTSPTNTVTMTSDKSVRVFFKWITRTLTIQTPSPSEGGTISPSPGSYSKNIGEVITLTATPSFGWQIDYWDGTNDDSSTSSTNTVTITSEDKSVTVFFKEAIPTTIFTYSGTRQMNTPPFKVSSSPWLLRYTSNVKGYISISTQVGGNTVVGQSVEAGKVYETYVYNITGSRYFSVSNDGDWTLWVVENP